MEKVWLQCFDCFDTIGEFDPSSGTLSEHRKRRGILDKLLGRQTPLTSGSYASLDGRVIAFFGWDRKLFVSLGAGAIEVGVDEVVEVNGPRAARLLRVLDRRGRSVAEFEYSLVGKPGPIANDPTPFIDEEDFDIGLLISNISKSADRRTVLFDPSGPI